MSVLYCPNCGIPSVFGVMSLTEETLVMASIIKKMILNGEISVQDQKTCFICEKAEKAKLDRLNKLELKYKPVVNLCLSCFDLQIDGTWQNFTQEQKNAMKKGFFGNSIHFYGEEIEACPSCLRSKSSVLEVKVGQYAEIAIRIS